MVERAALARGSRSAAARRRSAGSSRRSLPGGELLRRVTQGRPACRPRRPTGPPRSVISFTVPRPRPRPASPSSSTRGSRACRPPRPAWPTWHSTFQTVPVMWASTSGNERPPGSWRAARYPRVPAVIVTAWNEADRLAGHAARRCARRFPARASWSPTTRSTDATPHVARQERRRGRARAARARQGRRGDARRVERLRARRGPLPVLVLCDGDLGASARSCRRSSRRRRGDARPRRGGLRAPRRRRLRRSRSASRAGRSGGSPGSSLHAPISGQRALTRRGAAARHPVRARLRHGDRHDGRRAPRRACG